MSYDVFVSHSAQDRAAADIVVRRLELRSIRCWVAPRDIVPGAEWGESIIDAIESCPIVVLLFSRNANESSQIRREVERAADKNIYTIPFRLDDTEPSRSLEYFISNSQWMDAFPPPLEPHVDALAATISRVLARLRAVDPTATDAERKVQQLPQTIQPAPGRRLPLLPIGGFTVVALSIGLIWYSRLPTSGLVAVPSVRTRSIADAESTLVKAHLTYTVKTVRDRSANPGTILNQEPEPLMKVPEGTNIALTAIADEDLYAFLVRGGKSLQVAIENRKLHILFAPSSGPVTKTIPTGQGGWFDREMRPDEPVRLEYDPSLHPESPSIQAVADSLRDPAGEFWTFYGFNSDLGYLRALSAAKGFAAPAPQPRANKTRDY